MPRGRKWFAIRCLNGVVVRQQRGNGIQVDRITSRLQAKDQDVPAGSIELKPRHLDRLVYFYYGHRELGAGQCGDGSLQPRLLQ